MEILEDRDRIGRDLHDNVIGRLFATGMTLQAAAGLAPDAGVSERVQRSVAEIDDVITEIRSTIYGVRGQPDWGKGIRGEMLEVASREREALGFEPRVHFEGPVDDLARDVADAALATLREALTNTVKHARASAASVDVIVDQGALELRIEDNGQRLYDASPGLLRCRRTHQTWLEQHAEQG